MIRIMEAYQEGCRSTQPRNFNSFGRREIEKARRSRELRYFKRPNVCIQEATIKGLVRAGVDPCVAKIDLELTKLELQATKIWSEMRCNLAEVEYKRFLTLLLWNPYLPHPLVPTELVDEIWHRHVLDTRKYHSDMKALFGEYLHHFPFLGFIDEESKRLKAEAFSLSSQLYEWTFGEVFTASSTTMR